MECGRVNKVSVLILIILICGCSTKLNKNFYNNSEDILFQQWCSYMPDGYNVGLMSTNYGGVLAIVSDELIFDVKSGSAKPFTKQHIPPFQIHKKQIIELF